MSRNKEHDRNAQKLNELLKLAENRICADCGQKQPRWASTNLGIFVCIRCSGIHRNLGVHLSKVKSVSLDGWDRSVIDMFTRASGGHNDVANEYWEANLDLERKINEHSSSYEAEQFIRDKYERKSFIPKKKKKKEGDKAKIKNQSKVEPKQPKQSKQPKPLTPKKKSEPIPTKKNNNSFDIFPDSGELFTPEFDKQFDNFSNPSNNNEIDMLDFVFENSSLSDKPKTSQNLQPKSLDQEISSFFSQSPSNKEANIEIISDTKKVNTKDDIMNFYKTRPPLGSRQQRANMAFANLGQPMKGHTNFLPTPVQTNYMPTSLNYASSSHTPPANTIQYAGISVKPRHNQYIPPRSYSTPPQQTTSIQSQTHAKNKPFPIFELNKPPISKPKTEAKPDQFDFGIFH